MASTRDIDIWLDGGNEPNSPRELYALHEAFENLSDETIYKATEANGCVFVHGPGEPRTLVLPSEKAKARFPRELERRKIDKDMDFDEEADFYDAINNPKS